uniref:DNA-binding protein n=1 Tax=Oscillatoriales cyanobacterium SpSt-402 TaxID=2282168 RepID=A0A832H078_9CYAN
MSKSDWVKGSEVCEHLGISDDHLTRLRKEGLLKENKHWRNIARPQAARPTYRYHLKLVEKALEVPQELRG